MQQSNTQKQLVASQADVFISGGGPVGLMLAIGLAQQGRKVLLAEKYQPASAETPLDSVKTSFDGRVLALSKGSQVFLQRIGVWSKLAEHTTAIEHVHVSQKGYLGLTTLHAHEVDVDALGYSIQSSFLGQALWDIASQQDGVEILAPAELTDFQVEDDLVLAQVRLAEADKICEVQAKLIVGADGTNSKVRSILDLPMEEKSYGAFGILAQIETEQHPKGWAFERFTAEGPVALLPMHDHFHKAVLVCAAEKLDDVMAMSDDAYMTFFADKMGERLGRFTQVSTRIAYPLKEAYAPQMTATRTVLMGNASHTQHPVAAQGLNLGIRDIETFLQMGRFEEDLGAAAFLHDYAQQREPDHEKVMGMTDTLIQVFQHSSPIVGHLRGIGMMALQAMPGLKKRFSKFAMRGKRT